MLLLISNQDNATHPYFFLGATINLLDIHSEISDTINQFETCPSASEEIKLKQIKTPKISRL